ncbi:Sip1-related alpha-galactosidase [Sulfurisphaera javensis]|uniref:Sip1-related alpha-galactosidase n=1 Tax=Sulfurisphaera javensis TaxID=2049879 RepID=A0AAT9GML3_9CREN
MIINDNGSYGVYIEKESEKIPFEIKGKILALTLSPIIDYSTGFKYYNELYAFGKTDAQTPHLRVTDESIIREVYYWTYPSWKIIYPTIAILSYDVNYKAYITTYNNGLVAYFGKNFLEVKGKRGKFGWILFTAESKDPYDAIRKAYEKMRDKLNVKLREEKKKPRIVGKIGWCSWNAFLSKVSEEDVIKTVKSIIEKGLKLDFVLIDDGWEKIKDFALDSLEPNEKFSFPRLIKKLKELGINEIGLWTTINLYWKGFTEKVKEELKDGEKKGDYYFPPTDLERAFLFYYNYFKRIKDYGFTFVKIDNQCIMKEKPENIHTAIQLVAKLLDLDILNCMSMEPECYSNYFSSNLMRVSNDYIPMWREAGKIQLINASYNSLFYQNIAYPDFDMFSSYDTDSLPHIIARIFSGGPVYITDKDVEKTRIDLFRLVNQVDFPAMVTRDILFVNPYIEDVFLKLATKINGKPALALFNVNNKKIKEKVKKEVFPFTVNCGKFTKIISKEKGEVGDEIELEEMGVEVLLFECNN